MNRHSSLPGSYRLLWGLIVPVLASSRTVFKLVMEGDGTREQFQLSHHPRNGNTQQLGRVSSFLQTINVDCFDRSMGQWLLQNCQRRPPAEKLRIRPGNDFSKVTLCSSRMTRTVAISVARPWKQRRGRPALARANLKVSMVLFDTIAYN